MIGDVTAHAALADQLVQITRGAVLRSSETCWASSSFSGARHCYVIGLRDRADLPALAGLDEREFELSGHIVADIALVGRTWHAQSCHVTIEALTVEDA